MCFIHFVLGLPRKCFLSSKTCQVLESGEATKYFYDHCWDVFMFFGWFESLCMYCRVLFGFLNGKVSPVSIPR